jgi:hypothetical protein
LLPAFQPSEDMVKEFEKRHRMGKKVWLRGFFVWECARECAIVVLFDYKNDSSRDFSPSTAACSLKCHMTDAETLAGKQCCRLFCWICCKYYVLCCYSDAPDRDVDGQETGTRPKTRTTTEACDGRFSC